MYLRKNIKVTLVRQTMWSETTINPRVILYRQASPLQEYTTMVTVQNERADCVFY